MVSVHSFHLCLQAFIYRLYEKPMHDCRHIRIVHLWVFITMLLSSASSQTNVTHAQRKNVSKIKRLISYSKEDFQNFQKYNERKTKKRQLILKTSYELAPRNKYLLRLRNDSKYLSIFDKKTRQQSKWLMLTSFASIVAITAFAEPRYIVELVSLSGRSIQWTFASVLIAYGFSTIPPLTTALHWNRTKESKTQLPPVEWE